MANNLKIKKYWITIFCMVFFSLSSFAQELSDATIGFDVARAKISLKEHGVKDRDIEREISLMRQAQVNSYLQMKKIEDEIAEKYKLQTKSTNIAARSVATADVSQTEKDALLAIYNNSGGTNWINKTGWDFSTPVISWNNINKTGWYGVEVTNGHITKLDLSYNNLVNTIPSEIALLSNLQILYLNNNKLSGNIPSQIEFLVNLQDIRLGFNQLNGTFPLEILKLNNLKYLSLTRNAFTGNIPSDIKLLNNLIAIDLSFNQFTGNIPTQIGELANLESLQLYRNEISGEIPSTIGLLTNLKYIDLGTNKLTGTLPEELSNLTNLLQVTLGSNKLSGSIYPIRTLTNLTYLQLEYNEFTGVIPTEISMFNNLQHLLMAGNKLNGSIPNEIIQLTNLVYLRLSQNNLSGNIPTQIGQLKKLTNLDLSGNQLEGSIPKTIGELTLLQDLRFGANKLTGPIPSEINLLTNLTVFHVQYNKLTGSIPSISQLKKLAGIYFTSNELTGNIPDISSLPLFSYTDISYNKFRFIDIADQYTNYKKLSQFYSTPQSKTDTAKTISGISGKSITLTMCEDNRYIPNVDTFQWYKDGVIINGAQTREYTIENLSNADKGVYYCISKHPEMSSNTTSSLYRLILEREPITLNITNCTAVEGTITSTSDKFHTGGESNFSFETTTTGLSYEWSVTTTEGDPLDSATSNTLGTYSYSFENAGDYEIKLIVTDSKGCPTTFTKSIKVTEKYCDKEPVDFVFETTATNLTYTWTATDAAGTIVNKVTGSSGIYTFTPQVAGEYIIELVASSATSCKTLFAKNITIDQCTPYISCTKDNPLSPEIHRLFIDMITKLASTPAGSDVNTYAHKEIAAVAPYTTDLRAKIYNFTNTNTAISFSFTENGTDDVYLPKSASGSITAIDLSKYVDALTSTITATTYSDGSTNNSDGHVRNIDFCPKELSCVSHVALVIDESGSIDQSEANKIKKQLKLFVLAQAKTNDDIGSNIYVSITGMSDSDTNKRTDFIEPTKMTASNVNMFYNWIDRLGKRYGETGISQASDYWKSGLDGALSYTMKPNIVLMVTDGAQTDNVAGLKETFAKFDNNNATVTEPKLPHLYVVGLENGSYVDRDSYTSKSVPRNEDPNYNPSMGSQNNLTARTTPWLTKSLQYLLGLTPTEFPKSDINQFTVGTYYGHSNFDLLASDETYFADKLVDAKVVCGTAAIKDFCDDCFSFKPEPGKEYILSAWVKEESSEQVKTYTNPSIKISFYNNKEALDIPGQRIDFIYAKPSGDIIDGWQRVVQKFKIPSNTITLGLELENMSPSIPVYFDDIRIHPLQGSIKSFIYDPQTFKLMSELDENNYSTFYEYDNEGGLVRVKKETAKGVKTIQETRSGNVINTTTVNP
ncbi:hypothetical protein [Flavobacterium sp. 3-210]